MAENAYEILLRRRKLLTITYRWGAMRFAKDLNAQFVPTFNLFN
jgi:hypothetical protein